jgi:hypothetical protein
MRRGFGVFFVLLGFIPACGDPKAESHISAQTAEPPPSPRPSPPPAPTLSNDKLTLDDVLRLADEHAEESYENGDRRFDRGGLYQFAKELLTAHEAEKQDNCQGCQTPRACEYHGCAG